MTLRERLDAEPTTEQRALVPSRAQSMTQRTQQVREQLAAVRGGFDDAMWIAEQQKGMWPDDLQKATDGKRTAALIVMQAAELGVSALQAFQYITAIKGKPFIMARMVNALVSSRVPGGHITITKRSAQSVTGIGRRPGRPDIEVTISIEDAKRAKWTERNQNYQQNPAAMLTARVQTTIGWLHFADVLAGMDAYDATTDETMYVADQEFAQSQVIEGEHREVTDTPEPADEPEAEWHDAEPSGQETPPQEPEPEDLPPDTPHDPIRPRVEALFGELGIAWGKNVGPQHAKAVLVLGGRTTQEVWEEIERWAAGCEGDPIETLKLAITARYAPKDE